ncbi:MAG: aminomethyl-transferring glycine dehydrogenase subunit GcvPA [Candidatus Altiarchaeota archaeon]
MHYNPNSPQEREQMLSRVGAKKVEDLYADIPEGVRLKGGLRLPKGLSEMQLRRHMGELAGMNRVRTSFLGAGAYEHHIPSAVGHMVGRSEFYTAYTPYQAEVSQGVLQALFEYQSIMCELTGQEVSNATLYDGATALAEASVMAHNITKRNEILVSDTLHPEYRMVLKTYCEAGGLELRVVASGDGTSSNLVPTEKTAAVVIQSPNFFGIVEDSDALQKRAHEMGSLLIGCVVEAASLGMLKPPPADIVVGDGQSFGNPVSFGGPTFGFLTTSMKYVRHVPGRLVGETADSDGKRGYVLTLQAREQHIRREKATSNICTAQSLCGIAAAAHIALLGPEGLKRMSMNSHKNAVYLAGRLSKLKGFSLVYKKPFFNEFVLRCPEGTYGRLRTAGFTPGLELGRFYPGLKGCLLLCTTEVHSKSELDAVAEALG